MTPTQQYATAWKITGQQHDLLTCLAISPSGAHLVVASEDRTLLLVDVSDGHILVKVCFEGQFWILCALWYTDSNLVVGCSNGSLYEVCFKPTNNNYVATMTPFLVPFKHHIRSLAFDPARLLLAVGYGSTVALFTYREPNRENPHSEWEHFEVIKGPCNNESGLVNALLFYTANENTRNLLIGYAEAGWNVWSGLAPVKRISSTSNDNTCRIGRATLTADEKSLAVSTLDHAIITYRLGADGPILGSMKEFPYYDSGEYSPIVPIASTPDGLTLAGTTRGEVPMIEDSNGEMSLMQHEEPNHLIRVIATHGQSIIIGSSSWADSTLKCYRPSVVRSVNKRTGDPALITVTDALLGWDLSDSGWGGLSRPNNMKREVTIKRAMWCWIVGASIIAVLILSADPPSGPSFEDAKKESPDTDVFKPSFKRHEYWVFFGIRHFMKYARFQFLVWTAWVVHVTYSFLSGVVQVLPEAADFIGLGAAKWICERVEVYKELGVCPKLDY